jgi:hypothetical protein
MQPAAIYSAVYPNRGPDQQQMSDRSTANDLEQPSSHADDADMSSLRRFDHESAKPPASLKRQMMGALKTTVQTLSPCHFETDSKGTGINGSTGAERAPGEQHRALAAAQEDNADPSEEQSSSLERKESGRYFCLVGLTSTEREEEARNGADLKEWANTLLQRSTEPREAATYS